MVEDVGLEPLFLLPSRRVTITPHPLYGGAEGICTPVRNPYMNKTFLRNIRFLSVRLTAGAMLPSNINPGRTMVCTPPPPCFFQQ